MGQTKIFDLDLREAARSAIQSVVDGKAKMTRRIDETGRVCLPKEMQDSLYWGRGTFLDIVPVDGGLLLTRSAERCACCGRPDHKVRLMRYGGVSICEDCFSRFEPV